MSAPGAVQTATLPDIRANVTRFVRRWTGETRERAEKDTFWNEFLAIFGIDRRRYGVFEFVARKYSTGNKGFIDLLIPGQMGVEHKSLGEDLNKAIGQLYDYMVLIKARDLPHTLVVCDFENFVVMDTATATRTGFTLSDLPNYIERFAFLAGYQLRPTHENEEDANLEATKLLGRLHDALASNGYQGHALRVFLTRLLYILFADDTQVWSRDLFHDWLLVKTAEDGNDLGAKINELFAVLDTPHDARAKNIDPDLAEFAYVNGGLFEENLRPPTCDALMREDLIAACMFGWNGISPAIFGSLFQNVMDKDERRRLGAHYTSERDIMRTIRPLFLDELEARLAKALTIGERRPRLNALTSFRNELATFNFFDPACGCGNFLLLAYRELRRIELETLVAIRENEAALSGRERGVNWAPRAGQVALDVSLESQVNVGQFYGIEIEEFPARIAETAMHLVDHQANLKLSAAFGEYYVRLPIRDTAHIRIGNAMQTDWAEVLAPSECSYILGNPPFSGNRTDQQTQDLKDVWANGYNGYLDYVTGWYIKASRYVSPDRPTRIAFVSTNSICQGEAVAPLWEPLVRAGFSIDFAHRTFLWTSEASGRAGVHVVIVGWSRGAAKGPRILYDYPVGGRGEPIANSASHINAYLANAPDVFVKPRTRALSPDLPHVTNGSKPADGGFLSVSAADYPAVAADRHASKYLRPFIGARELLYGTERWCLWLTELDPADLRASPILRERLESVRAFRGASAKQLTADGASTPALFQQIRQPSTDYLAIPRHVGEARRYFPVQRYSADVIAGDHNFIVADKDGFIFSVLSSSMFITWMRGVAGRIRADLRFSGTGVWNTFPLPELAPLDRASIVQAGSLVLAARAEHPNRSLDDLYEPMATPQHLLRAHQSLDLVVDRAFAKNRRIENNDSRLDVLFGQYLDLERRGQLPVAAGTRRSRRKF